MPIGFALSTLFKLSKKLRKVVLSVKMTSKKKYFWNTDPKVKNSNISCGGRWHMFTCAFAFPTSNIDNGWGHEKFPSSCWTWWEDDKRPAKFEVKNDERRSERMKECFLHLLLLSAFLYPIDQSSSHCISHSIFHHGFTGVFHLVTRPQLKHARLRCIMQHAYMSMHVNV